MATRTESIQESAPYIAPQWQRQYQDPAVELSSRRMLESYFGPEGLISQQIPVPIQQVAGLSPQEIQARNLAQGLGGFGQQLAEAQNMYRQGAQGFDPSTAGVFGDPRARQLYEQSLGAYDPRTGQEFVDSSAREMMESAAGDVRGAQEGISEEVFDAQRGMRRAGQGARREARRGQRGILDAAGGISGQVGGAQTGAGEAAQRARAETAAAGRDLRSAGQMGRGTAMQGIAGLAGTGEEYDPSSAGRYMDPFNRDVIEAQQAEIARLGEKQKRDARAQQVQAGAFGGSRGAIQEAEIGRNVLQQQAKTGAELRSQGFQQAQQQAQQAFEQAQGRRQQAAQLTGSLGQAGAQTGISAAGQAGQLGLSAEQLAQRGALEGGQLGLSGQQAMGDLAQRAAQMGISTRELQGQLAQQRGMMGMQGQQGIGALAAQRAGIGQNIGSQSLQGQQLGSNVFSDRMGRMAGAAGGMGSLTGQQFGQALDAYGQGAAGQRAGAAGIAGLGRQGQQILGTQINTLGQLGTMGRGIQQRGLDAQYRAATQMADEPWMRMQRGMQLLGQGSRFLPQYSAGVGTGQQQIGHYQQPGSFAGTLAGMQGGLNMFGSVSGMFGGGGGGASTGGGGAPQGLVGYTGGF